MPDRKFGRIPSPIDLRDWDLKDFMPERPLYKVGEKAKWDFPCVPLDQEETPHCVGFSMAHFGINLPVFTQYTKKDAHEFYYKCKEIDGDPEAENGSTIRSAAKVLMNVGAINRYAFARDMNTIRWWLLNRGPLIVGTIWTEEMMKPNENNLLDINGFVMGGHAYIINEWTKDGRIGIKNSWGPNWGENGKAYIMVNDFKQIFDYGGEALAAVELASYQVHKASWISQIIEYIFSILRLLFGK